MEKRNFVEKENKIIEARRVYRTFDKDFKINAVKLVLEGRRLICYGVLYENTIEAIYV